MEKKKIYNTFTKDKFTKDNSTLSITFGDVCENHAGMQKIGILSKEGLDIKEIKIEGGKTYNLKNLLTNNKDIDLKEIQDAQITVLSGGLDKLLGKGTADKLFEEMKSYEYDTKAYMRGRVVNKRARWNHCFADFDQKPDFEKGKGTVINFKNTKIVNQIRHKLPELFGDKVKDLVAETNLYYDVNKTYIGMHGDTERKIVVCVRLGADFPLHYQWYQKSQPVGELFSLTLKHGDIYVMSEKAVGFDWKKKKIFTLRHSAGFPKVLGF